MNTIENVFPISGKVDQIAEQSETHIPSKVQADTLFTFTSEPEFLIEYKRKLFRTYKRFIFLAGYASLN